MLYLVRSGALHRAVRAATPLEAAVIALRDEMQAAHDNDQFSIGVVVTIHLLPESLPDGHSIDLDAISEDNSVIHTARLFEQAGYPVPEGV